MYQIIEDVSSIGTDYVKNGILHRGPSSNGILVESESDLSELPEYRPGTLAHTAGYVHVWEIDADGEWITIK